MTFVEAIQRKDYAKKTLIKKMIQDEQKNSNVENPLVNAGEQSTDLSIDHAAEVEKLKQRLAEAEARMAANQAEQSPKQEIVPAQTQEGGSGKEIQNSFSAPVPAAPVQPYAQQGLVLDSQNQVNILCELAFQKGLEEAIKAARSLNDPYILDEFHDTLVDKFYKQLVEKKKIEEV
jgi:hypothetical protein